MLFRSERFHRKVDAGARFAMTQVLFDLEPLRAMLDMLGGTSPIPLLVGLWPITSHALALRLHNEVPGITVPDGVRARMKEAGERGLRAGIEMAQGLLRDVRARHAGAYLMPSFGRFEVVAEVLDALH